MLYARGAVSLLPSVSCTRHSMTQLYRTLATLHAEAYVFRSACFVRCGQTPIVERRRRRHRNDTASIDGTLKMLFQCGAHNREPPTEHDSVTRPEYGRAHATSVLYANESHVHVYYEIGHRILRLCLCNSDCLDGRGMRGGGQDADNECHRRYKNIHTNTYSPNYTRTYWHIA